MAHPQHARHVQELVADVGHLLSQLAHSLGIQVLPASRLSHQQLHRLADGPQLVAGLRGRSFRQLLLRRRRARLPAQQAQQASGGGTRSGWLAGWLAVRLLLMEACLGGMAWVRMRQALTSCEHADKRADVKVQMEMKCP